MTTTDINVSSNETNLIAIIAVNALSPLLFLYAHSHFDSWICLRYCIENIMNRTRHINIGNDNKLIIWIKLSFLKFDRMIDMIIIS